MPPAVDRHESPLSLRRRLQAMLDVEVALAEAVAEAGLIPVSSVAAIREAARIDRFNVAAVVEAGASAGNLVIPLVGQLREHVSASDPVAAGHVHWGATSQDIDDTALVVQLGLAVADIDAALCAAADAAAALTLQHAETPMAGRTWLQQATPTTFGARAAGWLDGLERGRARLASAAAAAAVVQLGGAVGTLAAFDGQGPAVATALARHLGLGVAEMPWHTERSRVVDVACALGLVCGTLGKIGRDLTLLAQTEVAEVAESPASGRGGSSTMPHKQNPVAAVRAIAAAIRAPGLVATMLAAMPQELERAAGGWQAEWETMPALVDLTVDGSSALAGALPALIVDAARMRANLDAQGGLARAEGLAAALAPHVGRAEAHRLVEGACRRTTTEQRTLAEVAADDAAIAALIDRYAIARALDPAGFVAPARVVAERALRRWRPHLMEDPSDGR